MSRFRSVAAVVLVAALAATHAYAQSPEQLLNELGANLAAIRASSSDKPVSLTPVPDLRVLRGVSRGTVLSALGPPDSCDDNTVEPCVGRPVWGYMFHHLPPGWRGGGAELWLTFDAREVLQDARWQFSR
jgi:hypothetical protein